MRRSPPNSSVPIYYRAFVSRFRGSLRLGDRGHEIRRPIIVANAGFYSDLPDDLVFKVPSSVEVQALAEVLERLVSNETLRRETSAKAKEWATKTFSAQAYVTAVESLIAQFIEVKPLLALGERIGRDLAGWTFRKMIQ